MTILFTADLHLKLGQKNVPIEWAKNRYRMFIEQMNEAAKGCQLHIMGGDIFDNAKPTVEERELFDEMVMACTLPTLIYAGNHEATKKGKSFFPALKRATKAMNPLVTIIDQIYEDEKFTIVPYEFIHVKGIWDTLDKSKVLFTHIRGAIEPHVKPEIDLDLVHDFPVVYLGDLHSHSNCQGNLVYPGSPMVTSFHRHSVDTGYLLIDGDDLTSWTWHRFRLPQLIRKTVSDPDEMVPTSPDHTIYELEGSVVDLGGIKNSDLLDKKLVKRSTNTTLILSKDMTIEEEIVEYLRYVLELPENQIEEAMSTFHDYIPKTEVG